MPLKKNNTYNARGVFLGIYIFVLCNYHITSKVNFFLPNFKRHFKPFNLGFLGNFLVGLSMF